MRAHGAVKPYLCSLCGHRVLKLQLLNIHMKVHTGEKPFRCDECDKSYISSEGLKGHKLRHAINEGTLTEGQKKILEDMKVPCELCGLLLANTATLRSHIKSHSGNKDYECTQCGKTYITKRGLESHDSVIHLGNKNYPCSCGKLFGRMSTLKVHEMTHTGKLPFKCNQCNSGYKEKRNLMQHMAKQH